MDVKKHPNDPLVIEEWIDVDRIHGFYSGYSNYSWLISGKLVPFAFLNMAFLESQFVDLPEKYPLIWVWKLGPPRPRDDDPMDEVRRPWNHQ